LELVSFWDFDLVDVTDLLSETARLNPRPSRPGVLVSVVSSRSRVWGVASAANGFSAFLP